MSTQLVRMPQGLSSLGRLGGATADAQVLVVDDDAHVRDALARWLSRAGYTVSSAEGFRDAMAVLATASPHALVIDVRLRDFNGFQLALHARQQNPHARIVMISGWDDPVLRREAEACQASYMCKPFSADALLGALVEPPQCVATQS